MKRSIVAAAWVMSIVIALGVGLAVGQQSPPTESKGATFAPGGEIPLGNQIQGTEGRVLRTRKLTLAPGGVAGIHSHKERPAFAFILEGTLTEHREGKGTRDYKPGEVLVETVDVVHWAENRGSTPVVAILADIYKP
jgi:quercetin dioxygenase-like cupin family protein